MVDIVWNQIIAIVEKWYTCALASRLVPMLALRFLMKLDGILSG